MIFFIDTMFCIDFSKGELYVRLFSIPVNHSTQILLFESYCGHAPDMPDSTIKLSLFLDGFQAC